MIFFSNFFIIYKYIKMNRIQTIKDINFSGDIQALFSKDYLKVLVKLIVPLLTLIGAWGGFPKPPKIFDKLVENTFVQYFLLWVLVMQGGARLDGDLALIAVLVFVSINETIKYFEQKSESFTLLEPHSHILAGCMDMKMDDILASFEGDEESMKTAIVNVGVPFNVTLTDENAPAIATHLINFGYKMSGDCVLPPTK
jgi:hypothetical protein